MHTVAGRKDYWLLVTSKFKHQSALIASPDGLCCQDRPFEEVQGFFLCMDRGMIAGMESVHVPKQANPTESFRSKLDVFDP